MSYWPGELVQTLSLSGNVLSINPGNSVILPGGSVSSFTVVDAEVASISSLSVSSINGVAPEALNVADWSLYPATSNVDIAGYSINNVSSINGGIANFSTINTNVLNATSTIHVISSISSSQLEVQSIINLSTINGQPISSLGSPADWSLFPAQSTVNMAGNSIGDPNNVSSLAENIIGTNTVGSYGYDSNGNIAGLGNFVNQASPGNNIGGLRLKTYKGSTIDFLQVTDNVFENGQKYVKTFEIDNVDYATMQASSTLGGWQFTDKGSNVYSMTNGNFIAPSISTNSLIISSINGSEFNQNGIVISTINSSNITTGSLSSLVSYVGQQLVSTIQFNPSVNISPQFNIDLNMGGFLTTLGTGLFGVAVGVPVTAGTITYGLVKGLASLFEPRPINNINNNTFETFNYTSQLQVSTLGSQISTIYRFISTIPSTIVINDQATFSTVSETNVEYFTSTLSGSNPTCIRAVADPVQIVSTPWTLYQGFGEWVEVPAGGLASNISTLSLSTLTLAPSTIIKGDLDGAIMEVLEAANGTDYGEVKAAGYWTQLSNTDPNFGVYTRNASNIPTWLDSNLAPNPFALQGKQVAFSEVDFPVKDGNQSTITNLFINNSAEPSLTYAVYPPGFPSTTSGQIKFLSSVNGGYGGVQILSQLGTAKQLAVDGNGVFASDLVTGSNSDYPLLVQVPDLDQWVLLGLSTMGGGVGKSEIINTAATNQGQLIVAAPNLSTGTTIRMMYLDSASTAVGINNPNPQAQLDVGLGLNYASPGSVAAFAGNKDGTLEVTLQNQSAGSNASAYFFAVENTGGEYAGFGINSANLAPVNNTVTEIPGASVQSGTIDIVIAPQSDHSSNAGIFLGYNDATFAHHINSNGALSFNASYNGTINPGNFGTSNSVLITNGAGAAPSWTNSVNLVNATVSSLTVGSNITWPETSFAAPKVFLQGGLSNSPVINTNVIASPYVDTLTFYKGFTNQDFPGGYICLAADNGLMGVNKIPQANIDLDVNGIICASNISTSQISTNVLNAASAAISSISQPILVDAIPHSTCTLTAAQNWDFFVNSWGAYPGRQAVQGGYFITTDVSIGSGQGYGVFMFPPPGLSSFQTVVGTYFTNATNPGFNTPIWVGNATAGANGNVSTINVYGDLNADIMVSYLGYV